MWGISAVCEQYGLTQRAVRFYEARGLLRSARDRHNARRYDQQAKDRLAEIAAYRRAGLSIEDILEIFSREDRGPEARRACAIDKLRGRLLAIEAARRQAEQLLQQFEGEQIVADNTDAAAAPRAAARA